MERRKLHGKKGESFTVESYEAFQWKESRCKFMKLPGGKGGSFPVEGEKASQ